MSAARKVLALLLLGLVSASCTSAPRPRPDADAAVAQLAPTEVNGRPPLDSELMDLAWDAEDASNGLHRVGLLHTGTDALASRVHLLRSARERIDFQTFAWAEDEAGQFLIYECLEAARRGVQVRIIVDQMRVAGRSLTGTLLAHANLEVKLYNPVTSTNAVSTGDMLSEATANMFRVNQRMHSKVLVVDDRAAIIGGRNVEECYFDMDPEFDYIDRDALVVGPLALEARRSIDDFWAWEHSLPAQWMDDVADELVALAAAARASGEAYRVPERPALPRYDWVDERAGLRSLEEVLPHTTFHEVAEISFHADPPGKLLPDGTPANLGTDPTSDEGLLARTEVYLVAQSNYLVFTEAVIRNLRDKKANNPELQLLYITNSLAATGNTLVYGVSRKQRHRILTNGLDIFEMKPVPGDARHLCPRYDVLVEEARARAIAERKAAHEGYEEFTGPYAVGGPTFAIHAKALVIDGKTVLVGSHNFDPRSDELNTEVGVVIHDTEVAAEMERELRLMVDQENSWVSALTPRVPVLTDINEQFLGISRALPIFDMWPIRDYANYQLDEGQEPVLASHPQFYERYTNVREFPQVESGSKIWTTRLYTWFGGAITGLL